MCEGRRQLIRGDDLIDRHQVAQLLHAQLALPGHRRCHGPLGGDVMLDQDLPDRVADMEVLDPMSRHEIPGNLVDAGRREQEQAALRIDETAGLAAENLAVMHFNAERLALGHREYFFLGELRRQFLALQAQRAQQAQLHHLGELRLETARSAGDIQIHHGRIGIEVQQFTLQFPAAVEHHQTLLPREIILTRQKLQVGGRRPFELINAWRQARCALHHVHAALLGWALRADERRSEGTPRILSQDRTTPTAMPRQSCRNSRRGSGRQHGSRFDFYFRADLDETGHLQRRHGWEMPTDDAAVGFPDLRQT